MKPSKRLAAWCLALVAFGLTVFGVVLAATDPSPSGVVRDPLALNGYPPATARIAVTLTTSTGLQVNAMVNVDFTTNVASGTASLPGILSRASMYWTGDTFDASSPDIAEGQWFSASVQLPALYGISLELTKPDIDLISGFSDEEIAHALGSTTYTFTSQHSALRPLFAASSTPRSGSLVWSITTGSQGEVTATTLTMKDHRVTTTLSATVLSYNATHVTKAPSHVTTLSGQATSQLASVLRRSGVELPGGLLSGLLG